MYLFRDAGGKFGEMEAANEEQYFRKLVSAFTNCVYIVIMHVIVC